MTEGNVDLPIDSARAQVILHARETSDHALLRLLLDPSCTAVEDSRARFHIWSTTDTGHETCEALGFDPDLWSLPFAASADRHGDLLYFHLNAQADFSTSMGCSLAHFARETAPALWRVHARAIPANLAQQLLREPDMVITPPARECLTAHTLPWASRESDDALRLLLDAGSPVLGALRQNSISVSWRDSPPGWIVHPTHTDTLAHIAEVERLPHVEALAARGLGNSPCGETRLTDLRTVPTSAIPGIGERRAGKFSAMGVESLFDLVMLSPRRYLDRSMLQNISDLQTGVEAAVVANVLSIDVNPRKRLVRIRIADATAGMTLTFFNAMWQAKRLKTGQAVIVLGKAEEWRGHSRVEKQMTNPLVEVFTEATVPVIPIYPQSGKNNVSTWEIQRATQEALTYVGNIVDPLPASLRERVGLIPRSQALQSLHFPDSIDRVESARQRLVFDEFFRLQLTLLKMRKTLEAERGVAQSPDGSLTGRAIEALPFALTSAQQRVWGEVMADIASDHPMHRLVQGDVGSGKTLIAVLSVLAAIEGGHQAAMMAPTEILANQLHEEFLQRIASAGLSDVVTIALLTSKTRAAERRKVLAGLADGSIRLVVGTHSLISDNVAFRSLGLVVIDEQHRFGVEQRARLRGKAGHGAFPDMLVMTATPIPRTAAITAFGDLDVSVVDELPPGRTPIETVWENTSPDLSDAGANAWKDVRAEVKAGRQAFVVCPLVDGSEKLQASSATETFLNLQEGALSGLRLRLVHGQQPSEERHEAMAAMLRGDVDVLVSTTVIEVGVNIPNATRMVILDADRFGIAQLHQLRGRVGRGAFASRCYLWAQPTTDDGLERLQALCDSTDGFYLSEVDLRLRGAGNILGAEQSGGISDFRIGDILRDSAILERAREEAAFLLNDDASLSRLPVLREEIASMVGEEQVSWLLRS